MVTNPSAVLAVLLAAVLIWQGRRLGLYLLVAGAILPDFVNLAYGWPLRRAGVLMTFALITTALNWRQLR